MVTRATSPSRWMEREWKGSLESAAGVRPVPLFALHQGNKDRLIADGRRGGHYEHTDTHEQETLLLPSVDFVAFAVLSVVLAIQNEWGPSATEVPGNSLCMPDSLEVRLGTDDMLDAFRQLPVFSAHRSLNTIMW